MGDISTDLLSPGGDAHSRSDRELHGQCLFEHNKDMQNELLALQEKHPGKRVMLIADKGTMGVGSSRMSGVNNVALWTGIKSSPYVPFINIAPVIAGTNGISPIFLTTVSVTGGIGIDLKNWVKQKDADGNTVVDKEGDAVLEEEYSVETGTVLTINTKTKKLYNGATELKDISTALTPQKKEFIKGAELAYETILTSFASGDIKKLKSLLTSEMATNFEQAIEARKKEKLTSDFTFIGIKASNVEKYEKIKNDLFASVKFVSEVISAKKDKDNKIIEGDLEKIKQVTDYWMFTRNILKKGPNWYLSEIISK